MLTSPVVLFHFIPLCFVLSHCSEVLFSGWWTKEFLTLNKSRHTTSLAEKTWGSGVGEWASDMANEVSGTEPARAGLTCFGAAVSFSCPNCSPLGLKKSLIEYLNLCPCSLSPRQASVLSPQAHSAKCPE